MTAALLTRITTRLVTLSPAMKRALWHQWYQLLARGYQQPDWTFMNYGYSEMEDGESRLQLEAADEPNRYFIQLYEYVTGSLDLHGLNVLEVGCGRGGGCAYLTRSKQPQSMLGVDYSAHAVTLCQKLHVVPALSFRQGDAESLPCADSVFDVVINVESSHCYGAMETFLSEVYRVLKPGGHFLWADMRSVGQLEETRCQFRKSGLELAHETFITANVVRALEKINDFKEAAIRRHAPKFLQRPFQDFAGIKGTRVHEALRNGEVVYLSCVFQKPLA
jgi:ubiquinone/menaquinone biosynthesis C-methylase UbiE